MPIWWLGAQESNFQQNAEYIYADMSPVHAPPLQFDRGPHISDGISQGAVDSAFVAAVRTLGVLLVSAAIRERDCWLSKMALSPIA